LWEEQRRAGPGEHVHFTEGRSEPPVCACANKAQKLISRYYANTQISDETRKSVRDASRRRQEARGALRHWKVLFSQ